MSESSVNVRYMVGDVQAATDWYVGHFGFSVQLNAAPAFASVERGPLRLLLSGRASSAGRPSASSTRDSSSATAPANSAEACTEVRKCPAGRSRR